VVLQEITLYKKFKDLFRHFIIQSGFGDSNNMYNV